jgi:hypothetical protein
MAAPTTGKNDSIVVSALQAPANFGKLLSRVDSERRSLVARRYCSPSRSRRVCMIASDAGAIGTEDAGFFGAGTAVWTPSGIEIFLGERERTWKIEA